jgi:DNA-binding phage protein
MIALRRLSKAFGGVSNLAERAELNLNMLYRTVLAKSNRETKGPSGHELQLKVRPMRERAT